MANLLDETLEIVKGIGKIWWLERHEYDDSEGSNYIVWNDCTRELPKGDDFYLLVYYYDFGDGVIIYDSNIGFDRALYKDGVWSLWANEMWLSLEEIKRKKCMTILPLKWSKIDLEQFIEQ